MAAPGHIGGLMKPPKYRVKMSRDTIDRIVALTCQNPACEYEPANIVYCWVSEVILDPVIFLLADGHRERYIMAVCKTCAAIGTDFQEQGYRMNQEQSGVVPHVCNFPVRCQQQPERCLCDILEETQARMEEP